MPTPAWREEKSSKVVRAICRTLAAAETPDSIRGELGLALRNALKLFADALGGVGVRWSPGLVDLFISKPDQAEVWLALMAEPDFSASGYWERGGQ